VFVLAVWRTGYVSIGSLAGALVLPVAAWIAGMSRPVVAGAAAASAFIVFKHRANLHRLRAGNERRLGQRT
jgi:glycerol-3-phosphate acyltransferase PlsY